MPKHSTPAERASRAAADTTETRRHLQKHREHRRQHEMIALSGVSMLLGDEPRPNASKLELLTVEQHGVRIPMTPKEKAALESLAADHPDVPLSLTRRDPGESGPVLAQFGEDTYLIDGQTVTKAV